MDGEFDLAIAAFNRVRKSCVAYGIAITPSHNPPEGGGSKYNPAALRPCRN